MFTFLLFVSAWALFEAVFSLWASLITICQNFNSLLSIRFSITAFQRKMTILHWAILLPGQLPPNNNPWNNHPPDNYSTCQLVPKQSDPPDNYPLCQLPLDNYLPDNSPLDKCSWIIVLLLENFHLDTYPYKEIYVKSFLLPSNRTSTQL